MNSKSQMTVVDPEAFLSGSPSPLEYFKKWYHESKALGLRNADAMILSTVGVDGRPRSRVVLLKEQRPHGLVFFTNYESQKGRDLAKNNECTLLFYWDALFRQVHFSGHVEKISREDSVKYWRTRPRLSQLAQWVSKQSDPVVNRAQLDYELKIAEDKFAGAEVPCPEHWGGFIVIPTYVEFWIGREGRFHDRHTYRLVGREWHGARLYP